MSNHDWFTTVAAERGISMCMSEGAPRMRRKLTITISDEVYWGLHHHIGRSEISRFIERLVRPHVVDDSNLEAQYREAALDSEAEREALEWIEVNLDEALTIESLPR